ncbi:hypothetical protein PHISCL_08746 [Aspergillus sclerotialis]|uniref:Uncharacterized protein n=1 Tax=Aspergillus sclerotialis TaxID=2070753 RepID=A0A3A2ZHW0_9EURO|nr:hypothetical protein PHISCL_08746 [Aspergillus sclerotialis]
MASSYSDCDSDNRKEFIEQNTTMNWEQWEQNAFAAQPDEFLTPNRNHIRREGSKADKILGATALEIQEHDHNLREEKKRGRRPSFLRTPEIISKKPSTFVPFPVPSPDETPSSQYLRVRASSPLLGHEYGPQEPSPRSTRKLWKKPHQSGSSSTMYSHFNPRDSTIDSEPRPETAPDDDVSKANNVAEKQSKAGQGIRFKEQKSPAKESKRKIRPPRIDLSLLFPKPRSSATPLLSPQRMMKSPSQLSFNSEAPSVHIKKPDGRNLPATQLDSATARRPSDQASSETSEKENNAWFENSVQRTVRTSEFDLALDKYDELQRKQSRSTDRTVRRMTSNSSAGGWSKDMYLTPNPRSSRLPNRVSHSSGGWSVERRGMSASNKRPISKKSSKSTLQNTDLNTSSVLCLSSSEDEGDDDDEPTKPQANGKNIARDSVMSYDDFEPEICTASAAHATKGPSLRRVDINIPSSRQQNVHRNQSVRRHPSMSSAGKSSYTTRRTHSRKSSGAPTSDGSETHPSDRFMGSHYLSARELRRRSRVMAVTRQEEHLLEAMRQRKGKITPSIYQEARAAGTDAEQMSMLSVPSRDSFYSTDMSFLRLSPGLPPLPTDHSAGQSDKEGLSSQGTFSDTERKTVNSTTSPRASLVYTESLPSPATSGASPLTPTLPIHRFSPLPSQKPPPRHPPPAVPQDQRTHSRRRTDSSEAIVLDEADEEKEEEFPIWAYGLDNQGSLAAAVH